MDVIKQSRIKGFKHGALTIAIAGWSTCVVAQPVQTVESVTVIGQAARMEKALQKQRASDRIESVVSADAVAQLPDDNVAEALQRVPGISVERDQGEGRFVSVRGLGADLNSVNINGTQVPAPEADRRAVALDVLPSELIQSLSVIKTLTPDMDANSLGGTVEVQTLSAFDHEGPFSTVTVEGGYNDMVDKASPKLSGALTRRFSLGDGTDNFGIAAAFSWQKRDFGSENVETGGAWDFEDGARLEEAEMRDYKIRRERIGLGLNFDFKPSTNTDLYLRTLFSEFKDTETRNAAGVEFNDAQSSGERGDAEGYRRLKSREEKQSIPSFVLGGEHRFDLWTASMQAGYSQAEEKNPGGIAGAKFKGNIDFEDAGFSGTRKPHLNMPSAFYDPSSFELDSVEWEKSTAKDKEKNIRLDLARDYALSDNAAQVKFGTKLSRREKTNNLEVWEFDGGGRSLADFATGNVDYGLGQFGPGINAGAIKDLIGGMNWADAYQKEASTWNDFQINEDINAAYLMNTVDAGDWSFIAGMRYENTSLEAKGTEVRDGEFLASEQKHSYNDWLPSLHVRYQGGDNTQIRAAWTNSVVRPTFGQLSPGVYINGGDAEFGNPNLKPLRSMNFDLGIEQYIGHAGVASAFVFYKDIDNFVFGTDMAGTGLWADFDEALTFDNGSSAKVYGLELAYSQKLDWLPSPWNGLNLGSNVTFSGSEAYINRGGVRHKIDLPSQSSIVGNLMVGWENELLSTRLSANYKSKYLYEVSAADAAHDLYADGQLFLDFSGRYSVNKNVQFYLQAQNLTDEKYYVYTGRTAYNGQYEQYGRNYKVGMTYLF